MKQAKILQDGKKVDKTRNSVVLGSRGGGYEYRLRQGCDAVHTDINVYLTTGH
jgi:hypothetical protein